MSQWTDSARTRLEEYSARVRQALAGSEADAEEVLEDVRRHVEMEARQLAVVTESDVSRILNRIGVPEPDGRSAANTLTAPPAAPPAPAAQNPAKRPGGLLLAFGVILPLATILFEYLSGACAGVLFNPLPTFGHLLLVSLVPAANLGVWLSVRRGDSPWRNQLGWANGLALGVGLIYALLFIPFTPFALIGILFYGLGLVPLSPLLALICTVHLRMHLRAGSNEPLRGLWPGMAIGVILVGLFALPLVITSIGLNLAASDSPADQTRGVRLLRTWGQEEEILRACYGRTGRGGELYSWGKRPDSETARGIYYRVTGKPFNSVPPPALYAGRARWSVLEEEFTWDNDQGGDAVAARVKGLSAVSSRQDGFLDPDAGYAYLEWTLNFKNDSMLQREARAQVLLPPGAVVSRLTLWIDGEEREAAFGGRSHVKSAYKAVVQQRRDPVLVTTCGPDRVLVQCFPIAPSGGTMKVRLGITCPLVLTNAEAACLRWPCFLERNFSLPDNFAHSLWLDSQQPAITQPSGFATVQPRKGRHTLHGELRDRELALPENVLFVRRSGGVTSAWTRDTREEPGTVIRQKVVPVAGVAPQRVVFVVDGTEANEGPGRALAAALAGMPVGLEYAVLLARDGCEELLALRKAAPDTPPLFRKLRTGGGHDNLPALIRAWDLASAVENGVIVWVHGPQPVVLESEEALRQRFERSPQGPRLISVQMSPGPNRVLEKLDGIDAVESWPRFANLEADLSALMASWKPGTGRLKFFREKMSGDVAAAESGLLASMHLTRLWAADEVEQLRRQRKIEEAVELAARYQLVTPVSGAVVLETQAQYQQAGLTPVPPETVPSVPEPAVDGLLLLSVALLWLRKRFVRTA